VWTCPDIGVSVIGSDKRGRQGPGDLENNVLQRIQMILLGLATDLIVGSVLRALAMLESETTDRSKERRPIPCRGKQEPCLTSAYFGAEAPD
jgi:hypothetical protein